jgi:hypothetical protein
MNKEKPKKVEEPERIKKKVGFKEESKKKKKPLVQPKC